MVYRVPSTERLLFPSKHSGDMIIELNEYPEVDENIQQHDVTRIGNYEKESGETVSVNTTEVYNQGLQKDFGIWIETAGEVNFNELNERGNRISTTREKNSSITIQDG